MRTMLWAVLSMLLLCSCAHGPKRCLVYSTQYDVGTGQEQVLCEWGRKFWRKKTNN